jgi:DNA-binding response OmpR family regulator
MLPRANLLRSIWGYGPEVATRTIDIHISRLRRKLDLQPDRGFKLTSIYDQGYRLDRVAADDEV